MRSNVLFVQQALLAPQLINNQLLAVQDTILCWETVYVHYVQQDIIAQQQLEKFYVVEQGTNNILHLAHYNAINVLQVIHALLFHLLQWLAPLATMLYLVKVLAIFAQPVINVL